MILQEVDPDNIYCLVMRRQELEDLIKVVSWFSRTEAELYLQKKWQMLLEDLQDVRKQQLNFSVEELKRLEDVK
ncbi:MAG: hypothetical protein FIO02_11100 [Nitrosopumilales archaeon]|jgi:hypothetical protein|nr:hypothetical protein [Nitrosopumilales archaeon]